MYNELKNYIQKLKLKWMVANARNSLRKSKCEVGERYEEVLDNIEENDEERDQIISEFREWCAGDGETKDRLDKIMTERLRNKVERMKENDII